MWGIDGISKWKTEWPVITILRFPGIDLHRDLKDAQLGSLGSQSTFMGFMSSISPRSTPEV